MAQPVAFSDNYTYLSDNDFDDKVRQRFNISAKIKELDLTVKQLNAEIGTMLTVAGVDKVMSDDLTVSMVAGKSSHLSKTKLLELGVGPDTIAAATKETKYSSLRITQRKET
jgi:hypothetical protein